MGGWEWDDVPTAALQGLDVLQSVLGSRGGFGQAKWDQISI